MSGGDGSTLDDISLSYSPVPAAVAVLAKDGIELNVWVLLACHRDLDTSETFVGLGTIGTWYDCRASEGPPEHCGPSSQEPDPQEAFDRPGQAETRPRGQVGPASFDRRHRRRTDKALHEGR